MGCIDARQVAKVEMVTIKILTRLLRIRMVASSRFGSRTKALMYWSLFLVDVFASWICSCVREKKATSEPETSPEINKSKRITSPFTR